MEAYGIALLGAAAVVLLALASYDPADVDPAGLAARSGRTLNLTGPVGAHLAHLALGAFGGGAFVLACALAAAGGALLLRRRFPVRGAQAAGFALLVVALSAALQVALPGALLSHPPGGAVGEVAGEVLRSLVSTVGAWIVIVSCLALSAVLVGEISLGALVKAAGRGLRAGGLRVGRRIAVESRAALDRRRAADATRQRIREARREVIGGGAQPPEEQGAAWSFGEDAGLPSPGSPAVEWSFDDESDVGLVRLTLDDPAISVEDDDREFPARLGPPPPPPPASGLGPAIADADGPAAAAARRRARPPALELEIVEHEQRAQPRERPVQRDLGLGGDRDFELPPLSLLDYDDPDRIPVDRQALAEQGAHLLRVLADYKVEGEVRKAHPGPVVTMFEFKPAAGTKLSKIAGLAAEIAMELSAKAVRIVAPIPGRDVVGIEVPSPRRETVFLKEVIADDAFGDRKKHLPLSLGKDIFGEPVVADLARMPHLLVAGTTGSGKSVAVNCMVLSLLYRYGPDELKLLLVDPKQLEFNIYEGIPHLLAPVVTDPRHAAGALRWAVDEMERRYEVMAATGVRNVVDYNKRCAGRPVDPDDAESGLAEPLPFLVVILDEFADLMMVATKDVESAVCRLAQKARAAGIHLILATQRPSTDVITGLIKANLPGRVGMTVQSMHDSRTIIGGNGCEHLLGNGDMLVMTPGTSALTRVHGPLVTDVEIRRVVDHLKAQRGPSYDMRVFERPAADDEGRGGSGRGAAADGAFGAFGGWDAPAAGDADVPEGEHDPVYDLAVELVAKRRIASASMIQRNLRVGYNRASRIIEQMERDGVVGPQDGAKPREVLILPSHLGD